MAILKGNKSLIVILPLLLLVWVGVGYKAYTLFFSTQGRINPNLHRTYNSRKIALEEKYKPSLNYLDPFLKLPRVEKPAIVHSVEKKGVEVSASNIEGVPEIHFIGTISGSSGVDHQAIIRFNSNIKLVALGDSVGFYRILAFSSDTLVIQGTRKKWRIPLSQN